MKSSYLWISVLAIGCTGSVMGTGGKSDTGASASTGGGASTGGDGTVSTTGGSATTGTPSNLPAGDAVTSLPTWRLTNAEYVNTVRDLLGITLTTPLDPDAAAAGFSAGLAAGDATVLAYHSAAVEASSNTAALLALVPCTAAAIASGPAACAASFIDTIGPKAFRRPLDAAMRTRLTTLFATVNAQYGFNVGLQALVEKMLQSPYFLYHLELEEQAMGPGKVPVTGYSMASRLSYLLWASMPDDELFSKAAAGTLSTAAQISAEATRMLADPKAKVGLRNFYEQWLKVRTMPVAKGDAVNALYDPVSILASFDAQVDNALWSPTNGFTTLLTGTQAYVNDTTAPLFGIPNITGKALQPVTVNPAQRAGILSHPALMSTFATDTASHPILRGVFVWDQIVCQSLPSPPPNVPPFPAVPAGSSLREAFTLFTSPPLCQACHARINPVGFLFEEYDTIGRYRTTDDEGQPVNSVATVTGALDSSGNPDTKLNVSTPDAAHFAANLAADGTLAEQCMVTQLYQYALRRVENTGDVSAVSGLTSAYAGGSQSMTTLLSQLTQTPAFTQRLNVE